MTDVALPIARAWISTGGTGAQNYDEFADEGEIAAIVTENPDSALTLEMPHRTPQAQAAGLDFARSLPLAQQRLDDLKARGRLRPAADVVCVYRIGQGSYGVFCMIDTGQISDRPGAPGSVIRNEDVFVEKVRERTALTAALGHLASAVLLMQTGKTGERLHDMLEELVPRLAAPLVIDADQQGRPHEIWVLGPGADRDQLLALISEGDLVVADGNHRSLAAQEGGLSHFLAVVTTPESVTIRPYHRLVSNLPISDEALIARLRALGAQVGPGSPVTPMRQGVTELYTRSGAVALTLPRPAHGTPVDLLDHTLVERVLFGQALEMDPGDKRITYVGGDYSARWLVEQVDAGVADLAVLISPVLVDEFISVNLARLKMPRKSTWFTPKARAGLVLAEVS